MVLEPNVSSHKQIVNDDDVRNAFPLKKLKIKRFHFFSKSCNIPLIQFIPHPKWCMQTFGPKPHLLTKYHIGSALFTVFDLWLPLTSMKVTVILNLHQPLF